MTSKHTVYLDVTELFNAPLRTGIQRVERELIRHWPGPARLKLCVYDPNIDNLSMLPDEVMFLLTSPPETLLLSIDEECAALRASLSGQTPAQVAPSAGPILVAELFFNPARAQFYEREARTGFRDIRWLVYDFLPYLKPDWFGQGSGRSVMPYLRTLRFIPKVAFISDHTRQDYLNRVMRSLSRDGPVIALGGDGIGLERQTFRRDRSGYVVLGTVEPRKRVAAVLEAFVILWSEGTDAQLTVIGRALGQAKLEISLLASLQAHPSLVHLIDASDTAVRDSLRSARAMIFASEGEGFGLPPFEALYSGIPVIVGPNIPSMEMLPTCGQLRLDRVTAGSIAQAVRSLEDDATAERLWADAARLHVPSWRDFASALAGWSQAA